MTVRAHDWPERLHEFLIERTQAPFAWGRNDCATFAADCVERMTGADPFTAYREAYCDAAGALRLMPDGMEVLVVEQLGEPIAWQFAQRGDVVLAQFEDRLTLGVCVGTHLAGPGADGIVYLPMSTRALKAWRIG